MYLGQPIEVLVAVEAPMTTLPLCRTRPVGQAVVPIESKEERGRRSKSRMVANVPAKLQTCWFVEVSCEFRKVNRRGVVRLQ